MKSIIVRSSDAVTLLGGGKARPSDLREALRRAPCLVAVDRGAELAHTQGLVPNAVVGDLDSISPSTLDVMPANIVHRFADQDSTDFDKALRSIAAPLILGVGFLGRRVDHQLANFSVLLRRAGQRCILIGRHDVVLAAPRRIELDLAPGSRVSLFPMARVRSRSQGLHWPLDDIPLDPMGRIGTSNQVAWEHTGPVTLETDTSGVLIILPRAALSAAIAGLTAAPPDAPEG